MFERLNFSITDNAIVIADVGDSLFGALDLTIHGQANFLSPAYYCSMGFAVPAVIGAQLAKSMASSYCNSRRWRFSDDWHGDINYQ